MLVPGVTVSNRNNPSQDPRISIRGFGARSAFGVRGIRILRDGIPLTLPDGQTPVDYLDLESVGRVEVMRGSASSLYGNAGGGVIDIRSSDPVDAPLSATVRGWTGEYGSRRLTAKAEGESGRLSYQTDAARTEAEGYRQYSRQRMSNAFGRIAYDAGSGAYSIQWMGMNTPLAQNPGALTRAQFDADPHQADPLSIRKGARKAVTQSQVGLTGLQRWRLLQVEGNAYAGTRFLDNPLTFAIVDVGRRTSGGNIRVTTPFRVATLDNQLTVGTEVQRQNDLRLNFTNCNNAPPPTTPTAACPDITQERGSTTLNQRELVSSLGAYLRDEISFGDRYSFTASARSDAVKFRVEDHLITATNPDDSGERSLRAVSPMVGLLARLARTVSVYANVSSAFETPTATELGNRPTGSGGINRELQPQRSLTYEGGLKGVNAAGAQYSATVFTTSVHDELIPFDIPASGGRRYFRNAGRTQRRGVELSGSLSAGPAALGAAYTLANYRFRDFLVDTAQYAGNRIPGIPSQTLQLSASLPSVIGRFVAELNAANKMFVNDANSERAPGYAIVNVRLVSSIAARRSGAELTIGAQNVFDTPWVSSVSVNAAGGKFYEPGSERSVYVGVTLSAASRDRR
jgi:iron complex outermembrane receptor protein